MELAQEVEKKRISTTEKENMIGLISYTQSMEDCRAPLIIEAIVEKIEAKSALFLEWPGSIPVKPFWQPILPPFL